MAGVESFVRLFFAASLSLGVAMLLMPEWFERVVVRGTADLHGDMSTRVLSAPHTAPVCNCNADSLCSARQSNDSFASLTNPNPMLVQIAVNSEPFTVSLTSINALYVRAKAVEFCVEKTQFTTETLHENCAKPLARQLFKEIESGRTKTLRLPIPAPDDPQTNPHTQSEPIGVANDKPQLVFPAEQTVLIGEDGHTVHVRIPFQSDPVRLLTFDVSAQTFSDATERFCAALFFSSREEVEGCFEAVFSHAMEQLLAAGLVARHSDGSRSSLSDVRRDSVHTEDGDEAAKRETDTVLSEIVGESHPEESNSDASSMSSDVQREDERESATETGPQRDDDATERETEIPPQGQSPRGPDESERDRAQEQDSTPSRETESDAEVVEPAEERVRESTGEREVSAPLKNSTPSLSSSHVSRRERIAADLSAKDRKKRETVQRRGREDHEDRRSLGERDKVLRGFVQLGSQRVSLSLSRSLSLTQNTERFCAAHFHSFLARLVHEQGFLDWTEQNCNHFLAYEISVSFRELQE